MLLVAPLQHPSQRPPKKNVSGILMISTPEYPSAVHNTSLPFVPCGQLALWLLYQEKIVIYREQQGRYGKVFTPNNLGESET